MNTMKNKSVIIGGMLNFTLPLLKTSKYFDRDRTRTCNPQIRSSIHQIQILKKKTRSIPKYFAICMIQCPLLTYKRKQMLTCQCKNSRMFLKFCRVYKMDNFCNPSSGRTIPMKYFLREITRIDYHCL